MRALLLLIPLLFECTGTAGLVDEPVASKKAEAEVILNRPIFEEIEAPKKKKKKRKAPIQVSEESILAVEDKLAGMTIEEKIGQLIMPAVYTNEGSAEIKKAERWVKDYNIGGIMYLRNSKKSSSPAAQARITNQLQAAADIPLLVSIDAEWGLDMRLDSTIQFPRQLTLGAIQDNELIYQMGKEIGRQCKRMGIHMNFAPVVDVNNNPNNPVINDRSFGENMYNVAEKGVAYMRGLHDAGVLATAKHFPGHGDTDKDSHKTLPVINHDRNRLDSLELYPFRRMIESRLGGMMIAHLAMPRLEPEPTRPSTLSTNVVTNILRNELRYDGLIITDAMNMQGVTKYYPPGIAEVEALKAGNDILLLPRDVSMAFTSIKDAVQNGEITEARLDQSVRKILFAKRWLGILDTVATVNPSWLTVDLTKSEVRLLNQRLHEKSITLVKNDRSVLPLTNLKELKIASIGIDDGELTPFQIALDPYAPIQHFSVNVQASELEFNKLKNDLKDFDLVLVGLVNPSRFKAREFGITLAMKAFFRQLNEENKLVLSVFGNPYSLGSFTDQSTLICGYDRVPEAQKATAEAIFGVIPFQGKIPVGAGYLPHTYGNVTVGGTRLKYSEPYELGLEDYDFYKIDSIAQAAIQKRAAPGCQILIAKDNKVIYNKAFGYHTYSKRKKVKTTDLYDLASITKIAATVPSLMYAYDRGMIHPNDELQKHLFITKGSNKARMKVGEVLNHTAGMKSWIPFYIRTLEEDGKLKDLYTTKKDNSHTIEITNKIYLQNDYPRDSMLLRILEADNNTRGRYVYSDLGYYLFKEFVEEKFNQPLDQFANSNFFRPLGMSTMTYNPSKTFSKRRIVPTEKDDYWRNELVHGYVHDMGAAMQNGIGGHAGLFANANDLAIYMQMLLNEGTYGGVKFFEPSTVKYFTRKYNNNSRRALGFDKPELDQNKIGPTCDAAPASSFGHSGFTGTYTWADPENDLIYIFLSNRVHPTSSNKKLITEGVRTEIQAAIYETLKTRLIQ